ncbi:uncharacterized protein MELLADRAFT_59811 [Melampsora larici-populina 98AG31]|uniref:Uncharacterized protein n=1 Tax=Melampsora larici-populina (strain 98AG31 / pathotype 3-4-7) TaxID=747676 RepID=F4R8V5_MELLP|nr:uncharacterized protein MELLADRAFT_59811 [Melampsora larici-populina 98AG31]EGG10876.1 hypothetical protein MELLADRAFT_59811 [Melampsora larici-populina 98AG31]
MASTSSSIKIKIWENKSKPHSMMVVVSQLIGISVAGYPSYLIIVVPSHDFTFQLDKQTTPASSKEKGKSKAQESSEDNYNPSSSEENTSDDGEPPSDNEASGSQNVARKKPPHKPSLSIHPKPAAEPTGPSEEFGPSSTKETGSHEWMMQSIFKLKSGLMKTVKRMDDMSKDFKLLSNIVEKGINSGGCEEGAETPECTAKKVKTHGGAVSVSDLSTQFPNPK